MAHPKVSFALVCYQQEEFVRDAVRSALAQEYEPLEIILSDDCSADSTFDIIEEEIAGYDGPHTVNINRNSTNLRVEHLNKVMTLARGDFVVIAHGDDISVPNRTHRLVDTWIQKKVSLVSSNAMVVDAERRPLGLLNSVETDLEITLEEIIFRSWDNTRLGATLACDREVFSRFNPIDRQRIVGGVDHILPFRAGLLNGMYYLGEPLVQWRKHGRNWTDRTSNKTSTKMVFAETNAAYDVGAMIYMLEELGQFSKDHHDKARMDDVNRKLVTSILRKTQYWTQCRVSLGLDSLMPTWVDKEELEEKPIKELFRLQPQVPIDGSSKN